MKKIQVQIKNATKALKTLAEKLEKIEKELGTTAAPKKAAPAKKAPAKTKKKAATPKKTAAKKATASAASDAKGTVLDNVLDVIKKSKNGATIANLKAKTGLESRQLSNALYKLSKKGQIKTVSRGVYVKA